MSEFEFEDAELIAGFREESLEHIEVVEGQLLEMESVGATPESINQIFRSIHTIKGGSGFLGFEAIKELSHGMESLMDLVRNGKAELSDEASDILLRGTDLLKAMLNDLANQDDIPIAEELAILERLISGKPAAKPAAKAAPVEEVYEEEAEEAEEEVAEAAEAAGPTPKIDREALEGYIAKGFNIYRLPFSGEAHRDKQKKKDFKTLAEYLNSFGCLVWEDGGLESGDPCTIIFATVLDGDFASASLRVEEADLTKLDKAACLKLYDVPKPAAPKPAAAAKPAAAKPAAAKPAAKPAAAPAAAKPAKPAAPKPPAPVASKKVDAAATATQTVRVNTALLNKLMNLAGELILSRNQLVQKLDNKDLPELASLNQRLSELQESVMQTRLQQVGAVFNKVPRMVRDLSRSLGKRINVELSGNEVELDRTIIDSITDPLTHLVRNSIDHGIEMPQDRINAGKPADGTLYLNAYHEGGQVNLEIRDDGKGIDPEILKAKALEKGLCTPDEVATMGKREALNIIFRPGFSTAQEITDISGRGVGMDVVKTSFEKLGGTVDLNSEVGRGTTILVKLPTTLAIVSAVIADTCGMNFAIPQSNIEEIVRLKENEITTKLERVGRYEIYRLRGRLLPVVRLADVLNIRRTFVDDDGKIREDRRDNLADRRNTAEDTDDSRRSGSDRRKSGRTVYIVVLRVGVNQYGLLVNTIKDVEEVVVKPLSSFIKDVVCFHGTTILGDGHVIMILDCNGIAAAAKLKFDTLQDLSDKERTVHAHAHDHETQSFLIFNNHPSENFALPLSFITRIEKVHQDAIEMVGSDEFVQIGNKNVPLFRLENKLQCKPIKVNEDGYMYLLIPNLVRSPHAIVASRVQDVVNTHVEVQTDVMHRDGVLGSAIIKEKMTLVLDIYGLYGERRESGMLVNSGKKHTILLVEDTPFFRTMIRSYLEDHHLEVITAVHGQDAWNILEAGAEVDLVLSDIEMPLMNGYELVAKLKSNSKYDHLPVMAITALDNPQAMAQGQQAGFDAYQVKLDKIELIKTIDELLSYAKHHHK